MNHTRPLESFHTEFVSLVAEENAVRAIAAMAEQTAALRIEELLLPEGYLQEYKDPRAREEEMGVDESTEEETEEETLESDEGSDYGDDEDDEKGKGKAREKVKGPAESGRDTNSKKKPKPAGQVLNELVGYFCSCLRF